jgi:hypothetical protein
MASITYWNRLEPRPRARSLDDTLAARLRDPLWLLTRQWQFGEFQGEDAGSPAFASISASIDPLTAWKAGAEDWAPLTLDRPLDAALLSEPFAATDLSLQVELAIAFERELRGQPGLTSARADAILAELRLHAPLGSAEAVDDDARRLLTVCGPRGFDGVALFNASRSEPPGLPPQVVIDPGDLSAMQDAQRSFARIVSSTFGSFGTTDPAAWRPDRLEFEGAVSTNAETRTDLRLVPELNGALDWYAVDRIDDTGAPASGASAPLRQSVVPVHVGFRGMPNARWWDFESGETDYGDLRVDRRDVAKLVVMDFMLIHGNDWFIVPLEQPIGSSLRLRRLSVTDVFGSQVIVPAADEPDRLWTLFTCARDGDAHAVVPTLVRLPSAGTALQVGEPIEDVRFFRDETANLVWAVERLVSSASGEPWAGQERSAAMPRPAAPPPAGGLRYAIQTDVPLNWIPFVPVTLDPQRGEIALERGAMLDSSVQPPVPIAPVGKILSPPAVPYQVREEEISRAGVRVVRVACRTRWIDGSTHLWIGRMRRAAAGEGSSGLLFDSAVDV